MEREIKWTKRAQSNFDNTVQYLEREWGVYSAKKFVRKVQNLLFQLKNNLKLEKLKLQGKIFGLLFSPDIIPYSTGLQKIVLLYLQFLIIDEGPKIDLFRL